MDPRKMVDEIFGPILDRIATDGAAQAFLEGRSEGQLLLLLRLLRQRFGAVPASMEEQLRLADDEDRENWADWLLEAESLEDFIDEASLFGSMVAGEPLVRARARGVAQGQMDLLWSLLRRRFGAMSQQAWEQIAAVDSPTRELLAERVLAARTLEDLLAE